MNNSFGISEKSYLLILEALIKFPEIEKAMIFGSRAMGNYKKGSDIDIAVFGEKISFEITSKLHGFLNEELPIPYFTDVINFSTIDNKELKKHILEKGIVIYRKH